jgi:ubiquinone/menaquinone biosynthesis C-methylase UbiE
VVADKVGPAGRVFASDIDDKALQTVRNRCQAENVTNVRTIVGNADDPQAPQKSVDIALIVNVLPMIERPQIFFQNVAKCLKPDGKLVIIQWQAEKMDSAEQNWESPFRNSLRFYLRWIYAGGFEVVRLLDFLPLQNIYVCVPKERE